MKVRMKIQLTGTRNGVRWPAPGGEVTLPDNEGADLCAAGLAEPVAEQSQPETATAPRAEKRAARKPKA
ncbi:MAG TPA: hypothetical protein PLX57_11895 [Ornithinibacter sp.]|nr:hypothetical protein [Ornithinibacter sp.]